MHVLVLLTYSDVTTAFFSGHIQVSPKYLVFEWSESIMLLTLEKWKLYNPPDFMIQGKLCEYFAILRDFFLPRFFSESVSYPSAPSLPLLIFPSLFLPALLSSLVWRWGDSAVFPQHPWTFPSASLALPRQILRPCFLSPPQRYVSPLLSVPTSEILLQSKSLCLLVSFWSSQRYQSGYSKMTEKYFWPVHPS